MHVFTRTFDSSRLNQVYVVVTRACNLACRHCVRGHHKLGFSDMRRADFARVICQIQELNPNIRLVITGGEPTCHPEISEFLQIARDKFAGLTLVTNGTNPELIGQLFRRPFEFRIQVSIDGDRYTHDRIRGRGVFDKALETATFLMRSGGDVRVSTTVNRENYPSLPSLFDTLQNSGLRYWKVSPEIAAGEAKSRWDQQITNNHWNSIVHELQQLTADWDGTLEAKTMFCFAGRSIPWREIPPNMLNESGCGAGTTRLYIGPDLAVTGCPHLSEIVFGSLRDNSLLEVMRGTTFTEVSRLVFADNTACGKCEYFALCKGGCIGASLHRFGVLNGGDPRCPIVSTSSMLNRL